MNEVNGVTSTEMAERIARKIGGVLIALNGTTALIAGGDMSKLGQTQTA